MRGCIFRFTGKNNVVKIGKNCMLRNVTFWIEDDNNEIIIGDGVTMESNIQLAACESTSITIGDDCMFSHDIFVRTTDSHPIYDLDGKRINLAKSVVIGNHVWVGMQTLILKGSKVADGSVIGARSLVNKNLYSPNTIYVGGPIKTVKDGIIWKRFR